MKHYEMRRSDRALDAAGVRDVLKRGTYCTVSTVDEDGTPYAVPLSYMYAEAGAADSSWGTIYVHAAAEGGHKVDNFCCDARVCVNVVADVAPRYNGGFATAFSSVIAWGRVRRIEDPVAMRHALVDLCMKYLPEHKARIGEALETGFSTTAVWAIEITHATGKARH